MKQILILTMALGVLSCQDVRDSKADPSGVEHPAEKRVIKRVFVLAMENTDAGAIYNDPARAPYLNDSLLPRYAHAVNFRDTLPAWVPSEPHYIWMQAGTNALPDHVFEDNSDPSVEASTATTAHLVAQIRTTKTLDWMSYQEGIDTSTGACPIKSSGYYTARHNPFVFFQDISGNPPSKTNAYCAAHYRPYTALAADLAAGTVADYVFITPNLCHDMHGEGGCPGDDALRAGDDWLRDNVPSLIAFVEAHQGVLFIVWDEGEGTSQIPFIAIGPGVKPGYAGEVTYTHSSLVKSVERILGLPYLHTVASAHDFSDLFQPGKFP